MLFTFKEQLRKILAAMQRVNATLREKVDD